MFPPGIPVVLALSVFGASGSAVPTSAGREVAARAGPVQSLCTQYAYLQTHGYEILNNLWGIDTATGGSQCTHYNGAVGAGVAFGSDWTWRGDDDTVKSYVYANRVFDRRLVSRIGSLPTTVEWAYNTTAIRANVAYDIFTHSDANHVNSNGDYELMIWCVVLPAPAFCSRTLTPRPSVLAGSSATAASGPLPTPPRAPPSAGWPSPATTGSSTRDGTARCACTASCRRQGRTARSRRMSRSFLTISPTSTPFRPASSTC